MNVIDAVLHLGQWGQAHPQELLMGFAAIPLVMGATALLARQRRRHSTIMGSARWATAREVRQTGLVQHHGVVLGRFAGRLLCDDRETHVLLIAPTRSGKGVSHIIPTLLTWRHSAIILDPKDGENLAVTARWRQQHGHVAVFSPCRSPHTCINVADTIRFQTRYEFGDAQTIAQSLTTPAGIGTQPSPHATTVHFQELATLLLTAALLHVGYTTGRCSLPQTWAFLTQYHENLLSCLRAMRETQHTSHGVHQSILTLTNALRNVTGERELGSIWSTAIRPLVLYNDPLVAASTERSTLDLTALQYGRQPLSLYLVAPSPRALRRLHPLYRVILDVALARLMDHPVRTWRHRLLLCADELPAHGYTEALETGVADMAGYGMKGLFVAQDLDQLEQVFGPKTNLWGNTDCKIFHALTNDRSAKRLSENLMGRATMAHPVESRQGGLSGQRSVSQQHVARALLTPDEVMELAPDLALVRVSGWKPMLVEKVDYRTDRTLRARRAA